MKNLILDDLRRLDPARQRLSEYPASDAILPAIMKQPRADEAAADRVSTRSRRSRPWVLAGATAAAVATVAAWQLTGPAEPGFAVDTSPDGAITFTLFDAAASDDLEAALAQHGVTADITVLPIGHMCAPGRFASATDANDYAGIDRHGDAVATIPLHLLSSDQALVVEFLGLASDAGPGQTVGVNLQIAEGSVGECVPIAQGA